MQRQVRNSFREQRENFEKYEKKIDEKIDELKKMIADIAALQA